MKKTKKLILANVFAMLSVVLFLTLGNTFGIEFGSASTSLLVKALFLLTPQVGFIYLYWMSLRSSEEGEIA